MPGRVWILGAGFSKAISDQMPVLAELGEALAHHPLVESDMDSLSKWDTDLERYLSYLAVDQPWLTEDENLSNRARFIRISRAIGDVILGRQNAAVAEAGEANVPPDLLRLVRAWNTLKNTIVTINYDMLVELAYAEAWATAGQARRSPRDTQLVPATHINARHGAVWAAERETTFALLKLHGSVGLGYSGRTAFGGETVWDISHAQGWLVEQEWRRVQDAPDLVPLIVPPTLTKGSFFDHEVLRLQWRQAATALRTHPREAVVVGYSLPPGDHLVWDLLRLSRLSKVTVIDPNSAVAARFKELAPIVDQPRLQPGETLRFAADRAEEYAAGP